MNKVVGIAIWLTLVSGIWATAPAVAVGFNVLFRPDYVMRDFETEYYARLTPKRVHWFDFKPYRLRCPEGERRVVVLHTFDFDEAPDVFLARQFPECPERLKEEPSAIPPVFSGVLVGRW